jgi:hypothetical protein
MRSDGGAPRRSRSRRHDLEVLTIPLGLLIVMTILAWIDTMQPGFF